MTAKRKRALETAQQIIDGAPEHVLTLPDGCSLGVLKMDMMMNADTLGLVEILLAYEFDAACRKKLGPDYDARSLFHPIGPPSPLKFPEGPVAEITDPGVMITPGAPSTGLLIEEMEVDEEDRKRKRVRT